MHSKRKVIFLKHDAGLKVLHFDYVRRIISVVNAYIMLDSVM